MKKYLVVPSIAMVVAACGGSESAEPGEDEPAATPTTAAAPSEGTQPPTTQAGSFEDPPAANLPGGIVLTIGDQVWEFESAQCAFYNARAGESGSEWDVSNIRVGLQVYVSVDSFGTSVTIADIANGGDPTLSWGAEDDAVSLTVDGDDTVAVGTFSDVVGGAGPTEGKLEASCASWFEG